MKLKLLIIDPIEPLSHLRTGVARPQHLGPKLAALPAPQPTTVVGALGRALGVTVDRGVCVERLEDVEVAVESISKKLSCREPMLMGPLLATEDLSELYVPLSHELYVSTRLLKKVLRAAPGGASHASVDSRPCYESPGGCVHVTLHGPQIGVALERREGVGHKTIVPGYTYRYSVVIYRDFATKAPARLLTAYLFNCEGELDMVARVGGEGRVARVRTETAPTERLAGLVSPLEHMDPGLYLSVGYVPLIPKSPGVTNLRLRDFYGLEFLGGEEDIVGVPRDVPYAPPKVRIERLGLGFSESQGRRRPQVLALPPGTLLKVRSKGPVRSVGLVEVLWRIGYATLYGWQPQ